MVQVVEILPCPNKEPFIYMFFPTLSALYLRHYELAHAEKKHFCPECQEGFSRKYFLIRHMARLHKHTAGIYYCQLCSYSAANPASYKTHLLKKHDIGHEEQQAKLAELEQQNLEAEARGQLIKMARKQRKRTRKTKMIAKPKTLAIKDSCTLDAVAAAGTAATASIVQLTEDGRVVTTKELGPVRTVEEVTESVAVISTLMEPSGENVMSEDQLHTSLQGSQEARLIQAITPGDKLGNHPVSKVLLWDGIKTVEVEIPEVQDDTETAQILTTDGSSVLVQTDGGDVQSEQFQFTVDLGNPSLEDDPSVQYVVYLNE